MKNKKIKTNQLRVGFELETALDDEIDIGEYHEGHNITNHWRSEQDSSLCSDLYPVELISDPLTLGAFEERKQELLNYLLNEDVAFLEINKSMGLHCHFSIKGLNLYGLFSLPLAVSLRQAMFEAVKKKYGQRAFETFKSQYFRSYAKKINKRNFYRGRYNEFNFNSHYTTIEWRSLNILFINDVLPRDAGIEKQLDFIFEFVWLVYKVFFKEFLKFINRRIVYTATTRIKQWTKTIKLERVKKKVIITPVTLEKVKKIKVKKFRVII